MKQGRWRSCGNELAKRKMLQMKLNRKSCMLILALLVATVGWNYVSAVHGGPKAKECLKVVDQNGKPVQGAKIRGGFVTGDGLDDYTPVDGFTDAKGRLTAQDRAFGCAVAIFLRAVNVDGVLDVLASGINLDGGSVRIGGDSATPEPSGCLLMLMGIAALGLRRRPESRTRGNRGESP